MERQALRELSSYFPPLRVAPVQNDSSENGVNPPLPIAVAESELRKSALKPNRSKRLPRSMTTLPFDLVVALDRSDATAAVAVFDLTAGSLTQSEVSLAPEALETWWTELRAKYPAARIAVAFEQPAPNLLAFFAARPPAAILPLNPSAIWAYRQSLTVSRARTDASDARDIARFVALHASELTVWRAPDPALRQLDCLGQARRKWVDQRTAVTNRLQALLKRYYPQALQLMHEDIWRPMNLAFLRRWPTPQKLKDVRPAVLEKFFHAHGSRSETRQAERLAAVRALVPLCGAAALLTECELELEVLLDQVEALNRAVSRYDAAIAELFGSFGPEAAIFRELPGAGPALAPRLFAAVALHAAECPQAQDFAALSGMAPVTDQSGKTRRVYRRLRCNHFLRQTLHEWAKESWKHSEWAAAFVALHRAKRQGFHSIIRMLAVKWIRILWRCWKERCHYDEAAYISCLRQRGSPLCQYLPAVA
jgi:transposase